MLFGFSILEEFIDFDWAGVRSCSGEGKSRIEVVSV